MKYLSLLVLAFLSFHAAAAEVRLSWEPPTTRVNGDPLDPATELQGYTLTCSVGSQSQATEIPATVATPYQVDGADAFPAYGENLCTLTATDTEGRKSRPSDPVAIPWRPGPSAPTRFMVITDGVGGSESGSSSE